MAKSIIIKSLCVAVLILFLATLFAALAWVHHIYNPGVNPLLFYHLHRNAVETKLIAEDIINAIDKFRDHHGRLPLDLKELEPNFLPSIPTPTYGVPEWRYCINSGDDSYTLYFGSTNHQPNWHYESATEQWYESTI